MPLDFYTIQPGHCAVGQNMAETGRSKWRRVGHTEGLNVDNGIELFSGPWNGSLP